MGTDELRADVARALATPAAELTEDDAEAIARAHYGIDGVAARLAGEKDDNFVIRCPERAYFLKVAHPAEAPEVVDLHTSLLRAVGRNSDISVQKVIPARSGAVHPVVTDRAGDERRARLTTFIEGRPLATVTTDAGLREELGSTLATLGRALAGFDHPAAEWPLLWDLWHADSLRPLIRDLRDGDGHDLLAGCLDRFESDVRPALASQRRQMVHNDLNGDNVIIAADSTTIVGVIDFGDAVITQLVNDVASAMTNILADGPDPMWPTVDLLRGYHSVTALHPGEVALLYDLVRLRTAVRIIISEWRAQRFPSNRAYVLRNTSRAWRLLRSMPVTAVDRNTNRFMEECGYA
jgi:hydroxylysine kinase